MGGHGGPPLHRACVNEHVVKPQHLVPENNSVSTGGHGGPPLRRGFAFNHEIRIRGRSVGGAACLVKAGGINDRGNKPNGHKTKHPIPAIAGTKHPAGAGDHPGRLGDGRIRTRREAQHPKQKGNLSGTGGRSGPPLHRIFVSRGGKNAIVTRGQFTRRVACLVTVVTEYAVKPSIQNQMIIRQGTGGRSGPPLRRGFVIEHDVMPNNRIT